jgi:putative component of membrane protein insertase Oxa1/YidC/SpoIIIJ protein YidD
MRKILQRWRSIAILAVGTLGTYFTLVITMLLMRFAPERNYRAAHGFGYTEENVPPPVSSDHDDRIIRLAIFLYKQSWIRKQLHRSEESRCRFIPSCSDYCILAVRKYGFVRGLILIGGRFRRCKPEYQGDYIDFP